MITIKKYHVAQKAAWDAFVDVSINGTIFQKQQFLEYHIDRKFKDQSLIIQKNGTMVGLLPATVLQQKNNKILYSHLGASYGGLIMKHSVGFSTINEMFCALENYCKKNNFTSIVLINTPIIYFKQLDFSLDYLMQWHGFKQKELYVSHFVNMKNVSNIETLLQKRKQRYLSNNATLKEFTFSISSNFKAFYHLLENSKKQFGIKPTHSLDELIALKKLFPKDVYLLLSQHKKRLVGGSVVFFTNQHSCLIFYNVIDYDFRSTQLATLQLYRCMELAKTHKRDFVDFGVSHTPEANNPLFPKFSLIQFKEQFGARGVLRIVYQKDYCVNKQK